MIDIQSLTEDDKGHWVKYTSNHGSEEIGRLKGWNDHFCFVVFKCAHNWNDYQNYTGQSTKPEDLHFVDPPEVSS